MTLLLLVIWVCKRPLIRLEDASTGWGSAKLWRIGVVTVRLVQQGSQQCLVVLLQCKEASSAWSCFSNARKPAVPGRVAPMQSSASGTPFQRIAMNIVGPFPRADKVSAYILVIGDYFTKWVAYPMQLLCACMASSADTGFQIFCTLIKARNLNQP